MSRKFLGPIDIIRNAITASINSSRVSANTIFYLPDYQCQLEGRSEQLLAFDQNVYFYKPLFVAATVQTGPLAFTLGGGSRLPAAETKYYVTANGVNVPTFSSDFVQSSDSSAWHNVNGVVNEITFTWAGNSADTGKAWYSIRSRSADLSGVRKFTQLIGNGTLTSYTVTHNLNNTAPLVSCAQVASPFSQVQPLVSFPTANTCTLSFAQAVALNQYRVTIIG